MDGKMVKLVSTGNGWLQDLGGGYGLVWSYGTAVAIIHETEGVVRRCWWGWSVTTAKHIRMALKALKCPVSAPCKAVWLNMPVVGVLSSR